MQARQRANFLAVWGVEADSRILAAGREGISVGREGDAAHLVLVAVMGVDDFAGRSVPELDGLVGTAGDELLGLLVVGRKRQAGDSPWRAP